MKPRSAFSHYLPRLRREFYQADAAAFWTLPVAHRKRGWLNDGFHREFREVMLHTAAREGLACPACCLMPDHIHLVWLGLRCLTDQRNGMRFLRSKLAPLLTPARFQHQAHDHVLTPAERKRQAFSVACGDYVLLNPLRAGLVDEPDHWPYLGAVIPGYYAVNPFEPGYWEWFWKRLTDLREPGIGCRVLPPREME